MRASGWGASYLSSPWKWWVWPSCFFALGRYRGGNGNYRGADLEIFLILIAVEIIFGLCGVNEPGDSQGQPRLPLL